MGDSRRGPRRVQSTEREHECLLLRRQGLTYRAIGQRVGIRESQAYRLVKRAYDHALKVNDDEANFNRKLDLERLDAALEGLWPKVQAGVPRAVDALLGILDRRAKLLGLDQAVKSDANLTIRVLRGDDDRPPAD